MYKRSFDPDRLKYVDVAEDELMHGKEWTKHKYVSKFMKNGKWIYRYAITGKGYKARQKMAESLATRHIDSANTLLATRGATIRTINGRENVEYSSLSAAKEGKKKTNAANAHLDKSVIAQKKADQAEKDYNTKSLFGMSEAVVNKGKASVADILRKLANKLG